MGGTGSGRKSKPKRDHKIKLNIRMRRGLMRRIDEVRKFSNRSRTELIESYLESLVFSDKAYCAYELRQAKMKVAYWQYEMIKEEARESGRQLKLVTE